MGFQELYLYNFRNFETLKIDLNFPEVYFVGKNGQGKTNILESLYYLCYGSSFRTKNDNIILNHNNKNMSASAIFIKNDKSLNKIHIIFDNNIKKIKFNENNISDRRDIMYNMPCIVFCHGDLEFVVGSPDKKRQFFDQTLSLLDLEYVDLLRKYKIILKEKNKLLKNSINKELISVYSKQLVDFGIKITQKRNILIDDINLIINKLFYDISDLKGDLKIDYISSWKNSKSEEIFDFVEKKINYEIKMKTSCYGPHRDNFKFNFNGKDFIEFASTGQLRLLSLILRAAQGNLYFNKTKREPILLLDDVLLELDNEKRDNFMNKLPPHDQAFYTFLPDSSALKNKKAKIYFVEKGNILNEESE